MQCGSMKETPISMLKEKKGGKRKNHKCLAKIERNKPMHKREKERQIEREKPEHK
jgi:hypothetical protein